MINFSNEQKKVLEKYPFKATKHYLDLANLDNPNDPILKQIMPDIAELEDINSSFDPLEENKHLVTSRLVHRYQDRALLLTTGNCKIRCRFCLRKRFWNGTDNNCPDINEQEIEDAVNYVKNHTEISEIILSGGDVLTFNNQKVENIIKSFHNIEHINVIRIASRMLTIEPSRFDDELLEIFSKYHKLWMMTHFNHPNEISELSCKKALQISKTGLIMLNQTVLLKGINDNIDTQIKLAQKLVSIKIKPHYLFHIDPVQGVRHFATGIEKGIDLLHQMRGKLSSIATPTFAIDLPHGGGKVNLQYSYERDGEFLNTEENAYINYMECSKHS